METSGKWTARQCAVRSPLRNADATPHAAPPLRFVVRKVSALLAASAEKGTLPFF
jgi:hypothetical protein